ncbi:P97 family adhesin [Mycoplasma sp. 'Moose RK']|uniref:P97 family adhesin n=1 Tax=Mycoplasma sp. 'Moose RK' TaxID=2780095 RepID=UPI0018C1DD41|nr:adhesin [Mycoplasma sp. 'Moose RK']MBG0730723.1 adhesin [Mycoplasma sp. 'Moose RK']
MKKIKSKNLTIGLTTAASCLGFFGLVVGLSTTAKYNAENPRKFANDLAAKVTNLAFSLEVLEQNSDYKTIKSKLLDSNNRIKDQENTAKFFSFYTKNSDQFEKINTIFGEYATKKVDFQIVEIIPDDVNKNFKIKFQVNQVLENGEIAKSDIYQQTVAFAKQSNLLFADFNFALRKIKDFFITRITNFSQNQNAKVDPSTIRAIDFQSSLNKALNSDELLKKINDFFPDFSKIFENLNLSVENKLSNNGKIFDFSFIKQPSSNQFVDLQDDIPTLFLEARFTNEAQQMLADPSLKIQPIVSVIKIQKGEKSYFLDVNNFLSNLKIKDPEITEFSDLTSKNKTAYEFLTKIKSGFFLDEKSRSENTQTEINNILKTKKLELNFGNLEQKFAKKDKENAFEINFHAQRATLDPENKQSVIIPYTISVANDFFGSQLSDKNQVLTKTGALKLSGFKGLDSKKSDLNQQQNSNLPLQNQAIFSQFSLPFFGKGKEKQSLFAFGTKLRSIFQKIAQEEVDTLFANTKPTKNLDIQQFLTNNYDFEFTPYFSLLKSWTGQLEKPGIAEIQNFTIDKTELPKKEKTAVLNSKRFFHNGHQVASFFQDLLTKDQKTIIKTLFELTKKWQLLSESAQIPDSLLHANDNIFQEADKINLNQNSQNNIEKLSFNNIWKMQTSGFGFYGILILPSEIKQLLTKKSDKEIFKELKKHSLLNGQGGFQDFSQIKDKNLLIGTKFEKFGDVLKAFFLKAAQFDNFHAWAKLDEGLKYALEFEKGEIINKAEVDKKIEELANKIKPETQGVAVSIPLDVSEQNKTENSKSYLPINFKFRIQYSRQGINFDLLTPETKLFLELESKADFAKRKKIKELDNAILSIPHEFSEIDLEQQKFADLTFPKTTQPPNSTSVSSYLEDIGKKIENFLKEKYNDKFETVVDSIDFAINNQLEKQLFFRLKLKKNGTEISSQQDSEEYFSTLKFKINIKWSAKPSFATVRKNLKANNLAIKVA